MREANRSLEDMDTYYRDNPPLIVINDADAICRKRPQKYVEHEAEAIEQVERLEGVDAKS